VETAFASRFGCSPQIVVRAPGRVNLIGEHTDYNDGFVLPMAINRAIWIALRRTGTSEVTVHSMDFQEPERFGLEDLGAPPAMQKGWIEYLKGTAWSLMDAGHRLSGWEGVLAGDVPIGAGLSSSAALEMATARAFAAVSGLEWDPVAMALLGQRAENAWVGVNCGIMDQTIIASGRDGHAMLMDCRSMEQRASRRIGGGPGHRDAPWIGRLGLQRTAPAVRGDGCPFRREGAARPDNGDVPGAGGRT
jgi:galactokinase